MIDVLRQGGYVAEFAMSMANSIANAPGNANLALDFKPLDAAMHLLRGAIDEMTVLGPPEILSELDGYARTVRGVSDRSTTFGGREEIEAECAALDAARTRLVAAATSAGLVG
jgi:hypothetical protein